MAATMTLPAKLLEKAAPDDAGCLIWTGALTNGYGVVSIDGRLRRAHRVAWEMTYGPIPEDKPHLDHLCRVRACIRPDHLEPVTQEENNRRAGEAHTSCPRGHGLPSREPGKRRPQCPACKTEYDQQRYAESREGVPSNAPADRTECPAGHPYDNQNTYVSPEGKRACRICRTEASRRYRARGTAK
jgi:hypothetical protein